MKKEIKSTGRFRITADVAGGAGECRGLGARSRKGGKGFVGFVG